MLLRIIWVCDKDSVFLNVNEKERWEVKMIHWYHVFWPWSSDFFLRCGSL